MHKIIGLPLGEHDIELTQGKFGRTAWDQQYPSNLISPIMIRDKIPQSKWVDKNFKMNFLILVYIFFTEAKQIGLYHAVCSLLEGILMNALGIIAVSCSLIN